MKDIVIRNFVSATPQSHKENDIISNALTQMQTKIILIEWPNIDSNPVNEFHTSEYITCAFPTLYLYENADLRSEYIRIVKPTKYFQHLLKYKDERFVRHTR